MAELFRAAYLEAAYRLSVRDEREHRHRGNLGPRERYGRQWLVAGLEWTDYPSLFGQ